MAAADDHPPNRVARKLFAGNLRRLRRERGLTQEALSGRSGLMQSYVSEVEAAKRNVSLDAIATLAAAMDVPIAQLFEEGERPTKAVAADEPERPRGPRLPNGHRRDGGFSDDPS